MAVQTDVDVEALRDEYPSWVFVRDGGDIVACRRAYCLRSDSAARVRAGISEWQSPGGLTGLKPAPR